MTQLRQEAFPVVLSAPSGAGKTTIARVLVGGEGRFVFSVSVTTRPRRDYEIHGVDYLFLEEEQFRSMVETGALAEWAEVHGHLYGTPLQNLKDAARNGLHVVLDIDVQGARQIRAAVPEAMLLFILPPSLDVLLRRLIGRGTEDGAVIGKRLRTALQELEAAEEFDFIIVNDDLKRAVLEVRTLATTGTPGEDGSSGSAETARSLLRELEAFLKNTRFDDPN